MKTQEELQALVAKKINGFCEKNGDGRIYEPVNYIMQLSGKRLRPVLALMSANLFTEEIENAVYPAIAYEVFHNFTLMHDDIMDNSEIRRGWPTVHEKWNVNTAILSGDAMMILAYKLLIKTDPTKLREVIEVFNKTALEVCEGQQLDMDFENRPIVLMNEYEQMIRLKTSVLLGGAMKTGALIGGADEASCELMYNFAIHTGLAFQMLDDYLDAFGDEKVTGKKQGGDIVAGKKTMLMIRALEKADEQQKGILLQKNQDVDLNQESRTKSVIEIFKTLSVDTELKSLVAGHHQSAMQCLDQVKIAEERKTGLRTLATQMLERKN